MTVLLDLSLVVVGGGIYGDGSLLDVVERSGSWYADSGGGGGGEMRVVGVVGSDWSSNMVSELNSERKINPKRSVIFEGKKKKREMKGGCC